MIAGIFRGRRFAVGFVDLIIFHRFLRFNDLSLYRVLT